jgi:O-antigen ligase
MTQTPLAEDHFSRAGGAVSVAFTALPFAAITGGLGLAPAALLAGFVAAPWHRTPRAARAGGFPLVLFVAFLIWCALSMLWSSRPDPASLRALVVGALALLLVLGASFSRSADVDMAQRAALAGLALSMAFIAIEISFDYPIGRAAAPVSPGGSGIAREIETGSLLANAGQALALVSLWIWPVAAMLQRHSWPGWIGMAILAAGAVWLARALPSLVILIALAGALVPAMLALRWPRATVALTSFVIALAVLATPGMAPTLAATGGHIWRSITHTDPPFLWLARIDTWSYATGLIRQQPIWGWGLGASGGFSDTHSIGGFSTPYIPGRPQSMPMQIWLETGAVGAILAAAALATLGRRLGAALANDPWAAAAAAASMMGGFIIAALGEYDAWAPWWWGGMAICAAMVRVSRRAP